MVLIERINRAVDSVNGVLAILFSLIIDVVVIDIVVIV